MGGKTMSKQVISINAQMKNYRPRTKEQLRNYVKAFMGISVPDKSLCGNHASPMGYLWHSFNERQPSAVCRRPQEKQNPAFNEKIRADSCNSLLNHISEETENGQQLTVNDSKSCRVACAPRFHLTHENQENNNSREFVSIRGQKTENGKRPTVNDSSNDCIVWAGRGGGKTFLAAIATVLDCIFKPGCKVRILGGSYEQSSRMYDYITQILRNGFEQTIDGNILKDGCKFLNGSNVEVLTQSSKSVRGSHIHKLRCDEIELFDRDVFEAAKFITKSNNGIIGSMEILSTMHKPYGLMHEVVAGAAKNHTPIFQWCVMEVIERCTDRNCSTCPLDSDCQGKAKTADGYLAIDDCITMMRRSSRAGWESEMMCKRPSRNNAVFEDFDADVHVGQIDYDPALPLYRTMDFGYINPFVCLWIQPDYDGTIRIIDEYYRSRAPIAVHAEEVKRITPCDESKVAATFCDPAGAGRNDVTGTSAVRELYNIGIRTKYRRSGIAEGIELVRAAMRDGLGKSKLIISPRCPRLIEALQFYHYPDAAATGSDAELPDKDGIFDHPIDALRYFFVNYQKKSGAVSRKY
jgi:hypothetical protein